MLLDINDRGLRLLPGTSRPSVGVFAQTSQGNCFGDEALQMLRLNPTQCEDRYWRDLGTQPPGKSLKGVRHHADLAWQHLRVMLGDRIESVATLAIPSHYNADQAALLSGILQNLGSSGSTLVNRSLLCLAAAPQADMHLDLQLHQSVLAQARRSNGKLSLAGIQEYPGSGILNLVDQLTRSVQQVFIDKTRFDPLHQAASEQQLFIQLLALLQQPVGERHDISIDVQEGRYQVEITAAQLHQACDQWIARLRQDIAGATLLVDHCFPLLAQRLQAQAIAHDELERCLELHVQELGLSDGFNQLTSLSVTGSAATALRQSSAHSRAAADESGSCSDADRPLVTHALLRGEAWPLQNLALREQQGRLIFSQDLLSEGLVARFGTRDGAVLLQPLLALRLNGVPLHGDTLVSEEDLLSSDQATGTVHFIRVKGIEHPPS